MITDATQLELLRRLAIGDEAAMELVMGGSATFSLDRRTHTLVTIAAIVALEVEGPSYQGAIDAAHAAGADDEAIRTVINGIAPVVGEGPTDNALRALAARSH